MNEAAIHYWAEFCDENWKQLTLDRIRLVVPAPGDEIVLTTEHYPHWMTRELYSSSITNDTDAADQTATTLSMVHEAIQVETIRVDVRTGWSLLHEACAHRPSAQAVSHLLRADPTAVRHATPGKDTPFHTACEKGASVDVLDAILSANPDLVRHVGLGGRLPLHLACLGQHSVPTIQFLIAKYPEALQINAGGLFGGDLPLHYACQSGASVDVIELLIQNFPQALQMGHYQLPLHAASQAGASIDVAAALVQGFPGALKVQDKWGRLPLHYAARSSCFPCTYLFSQLYPDGLRVADKSGRLPLHIACSSDSASVDAVGLLIESYPAALRVKDRSGGECPLHIACSECKKKDVIELIMNSYPRALQVTDDWGYLPLPRLFLGALVPGADLLVEGYKQAVRTPDNCGRLPLHHLCEQIQYLEPGENFGSAMIALLRPWRQSIHFENNEGRSPIDLVKEAEREGVQNFVGVADFMVKAADLLDKEAQLVELVEQASELLECLRFDNNISNDDHHACLVPLIQWLSLAKQQIEKDLAIVVQDVKQMCERKVSS